MTREEAQEFMGTPLPTPGSSLSEQDDSKERRADAWWSDAGMRRKYIIFRAGASGR